MTYPKAYEGVKKLVAAEALMIISAILGIIAAILGVAAAAGAADAIVTGSDSSAVGAVAGGIGVLLCGLAVLVLLVIAEIFMIIGLKKASEDEPKYFKIAFFSSIAVIILAILGGVLGSTGFFGNLIKALSNFASIAMFVFTVYGIKELAEKLGNTELPKLAMTIIIIETVQIVINAISNFTGGVVAIIAAVLSLIGYIIFLVYLTKAKKMLEA